MYNEPRDLLKAYSVDLASAHHLSEEEQHALIMAATQQDRTERIQLVYEQFLAEGRPLIQKYLAQAAQVDSSIIREFLQERKRNEDASGSM